MVLSNQVSAIETLKSLSTRKVRSVLICGPCGCGKSYLSNLYAKFLGIANVQCIDTKMSNIRNFIDIVAGTITPTVAIIDNLDLAHSSVCEAVLKTIEEPNPNLYIVVNCRSVSMIPTTISSRCTTVSVPGMNISDIEALVKPLDTNAYLRVQSTDIYTTVKSISDMTVLMDLSQENLAELCNLYQMVITASPVSDIVWKLQKFKDGSPVPTHLVIRHIMLNYPMYTALCVECLRDLERSSVSTHATISMLVFNIKYG